MNKLIFVGTEDVSSRIEISKKFINYGFNVEIIGTQDPAIFKQHNIKYTKYYLNRELNLLSDIKTIIELRSFLTKQRHAIIHTFDTKPAMLLPLASIGLKNIKIVRTITGMGRIFTEDSVKYKILRKIYNLVQKSVKNRVDITVFQNEDDYKYFIDNTLITKEKAKVIKSSGIDLRKFSEVDKKKVEKLKQELNLKGGITFILISRIIKEKGIMCFLEAAKKCKQNGYKYKFLLVGQLDTDGSITSEDIKMYEDYVKYLGRREDVKELLAASDVFVLPSYYREGIPRVLLEACAVGLPVITTDMPGCKDVVIDNFNGKIVKIKDSKDLYSKIVYLGENRELRKIMGESAKEKVKEFDLEKVALEYFNIYKNLL